MVELDDGRWTTGVVQGKGDACVKVHDNNVRLCKMTLKDAVYVHSYK